MKTNLIVLVFIAGFLNSGAAQAVGESALQKVDYCQDLSDWGGLVDDGCRVVLENENDRISTTASMVADSIESIVDQPDELNRILEDSLQANQRKNKNRKGFFTGVKEAISQFKKVKSENPRLIKTALKDFKSFRKRLKSDPEMKEAFAHAKTVCQVTPEYCQATQEAFFEKHLGSNESYGLNFSFIPSANALSFRHIVGYCGENTMGEPWLDDPTGYYAGGYGWREDQECMGAGMSLRYRSVGLGLAADAGTTTVYACTLDPSYTTNVGLTAGGGVIGLGAGIDVSIGGAGVCIMVSYIARYIGAHAGLGLYKFIVD